MSKLNGYSLSRDWFDFAFENPEKIKPSHGILYFFIIEHCNRLGWKEKFGLPTTMVKEAIGIRSYNTYINTLNDLVDWGFIKMIEKSKNQYSSNIVALSNFNKALGKALIKHGSKQRESTSESISTIDKQLNNLTIKPIKPIVYTKEVHDSYEICLKSFPIELQPSNEKEKLSWMDTIEKLHRLDNYSYSFIEGVVKKAREYWFIAQNFQSLNKLRRKNPDKILYILSYYETLKHQVNNGKDYEYNKNIEARASEYIQSQAN